MRHNDKEVHLDDVIITPSESVRMQPQWHCGAIVHDSYSSKQIALQEELSCLGPLQSLIPGYGLLQERNRCFVPERQFPLH